VRCGRWFRRPARTSLDIRRTRAGNVRSRGINQWRLGRQKWDWHRDWRSYCGRRAPRRNHHSAISPANQARPARGSFLRGLVRIIPRAARQSNTECGASTSGKEIMRNSNGHHRAEPRRVFTSRRMGRRDYAFASSQSAAFDQRGIAQGGKPALRGRPSNCSVPTGRKRTAAPELYRHLQSEARNLANLSRWFSGIIGGVSPQRQERTNRVIMAG